ncbi:MAG: AAA family ATPase [Lachnospiraceae bacterium]|nr:AAA family ATPase [Lachnospiraceae bacterium]
MENISVKNYRSIQDSGKIELKPLTVIVGKNSAGKSSFIRFFPLLKQTLERKISESILWYGDYVDLGDYKQVLSKQSNGQSIKFSFEIKTHEQKRKYYYVGTNGKKKYLANVEISVQEKYFDEIKISFYDQIIELHMDKDGNAEIKINGDGSLFNEYRVVWYRDSGELIPNITVIHKTNSDSYARYPSEEFTKKCKKLINAKKVKQIISLSFSLWDDEIDIPLGSKQDILNRLKKENEEKFGSKEIHHKRFLNINNLIIASKLSRIIEDINESISSDMKQTNYIKPIRAMVDRYYRVQGISIDELDADGSNLPMILHNMNPENLREFECWSKEKFGVVFSVTKGVGHVSLIIKNEVDGNEETNMADTGYGYSQMLPIVVMLWMLHKKNINSKKEKLTRTIVIEQPELHLHPAYQAKMVDVFVNVINEALNAGIDIKVIFETHSEAMINRIGRLISSKKFSADKVNVLVFDKIEEKTIIQSKKFNEKGLLMGWPMDFFSTEEV